MRPRVRLSEKTVARAGLLALAIAHWKHAGLIIGAGLMPSHVIAVVLALVLLATGLAMLLAASTSARVERQARWWTIASLVIVVAAFAYRDGVYKSVSETMPTTDGHLFMDVAARLLLEGKNPYAESLAEAFRVYRLPLSYSTPLLDGDFSDRTAYPAMSFLVLVPAILARIPTYLVYAAMFVAGLGAVARKAPWWASGIVIAPFLIDDTFLNFAFGGVTDTVWSLCLIGAVLCWRRSLTWTAVLIGLACAQKQHPWFVAPFLLIRVCRETGSPLWAGPPRRFLLIVAGVFVATNLPFVLWGPKAWLLGVVEPLTAPMIQLSDGFTALSMTGYVTMPRWGSSLLFWGIYALALVVYARHTATLSGWCWILPAVILWFGYRALSSYWYLYAPVAAAVLVSHRDDEPSSIVDSARSWRIDVLATSGLGAAAAAFFLWCLLRPAPFEISIAGPIDTWNMQVFRIKARVTNRLGRSVHPRFSVQSRSLQPLQWITDLGPFVLGPGETGEYVFRAPRLYHEFGMTEGARVAVSEDGDPAVRSFATIPIEIFGRRIDALPNESFAFAETRSGAPSGWTFDMSDPSVGLRMLPDLAGDARIRFGFEPEAKAAATPSQFAVCVATQRIESIHPTSRFAYLYATLALPESPIRFRVHVPETANRPPYQEIYGLALAVQGWRGFVLFGDDGPRGRLPTNEPFVMKPAPRGTWTTVELSLREVLTQLEAPLVERRHLYLQAPTVDIPSVPVEVGLFAMLPAGRAASIDFGRIEQTQARPIDDLLLHRSAAGLSMWRGELNTENGNFGKAAMWLQRATDLEPTQGRHIQLGNAYLLHRDFERAKTSYELALAAGPSAAAEKGLGFALLELGQADAATPRFERARDLFSTEETASPRIGYVDALRGLARASAKRGDCASAMTFVGAIRAEAPTLPAPNVEPCH